MQPICKPTMSPINMKTLLTSGARTEILLSVSVYFLALKISCILNLYQLSNEAKPPLSTPMTHVICSYSQNLQFIQIEQIFSQIYEWFCLSHFNYCKIISLKNKLWFFIEAIQCYSVQLQKKGITNKTFSNFQSLIWFAFEALISFFVTMMMG